MTNSLVLKGKYDGRKRVGRPHNEDLRSEQENHAQQRKMLEIMFLSQPLLWTELKKGGGQKKPPTLRFVSTQISLLRFSFIWIRGPNLYHLCDAEKHQQNIHFQEPQIGWAFKVHPRSRYKWSLGESTFSLDPEDLRVPRNVWLLRKSLTQGHRCH